MFCGLLWQIKICKCKNLGILSDIKKRRRITYVFKKNKQRILLQVADGIKQKQ